MAKIFKNKYRTDSARLQNWDYGWDGAYFITICTKNRECSFGDVYEQKMELSRIGIIADICWTEIKRHSDHIELGEYIVMPNHIHGIVILSGNPVETRHALSLPHVLSLRDNHNQSIGQQRFQNQGKNTISSIIGSYKSAVTKHARRLGFEFNWQSRFHDHIIRDQESFDRISEYIRNNRINWEKDKHFRNTSSF